MIHWSDRTQEERALLNPGFCASLLWHAARGYANEANEMISFEEAFLVLTLRPASKYSRSVTAIDSYFARCLA